MSVGQQEIVNKLQSLGLKPGAHVIVHSSLSSFGKVAGGSQTVIRALRDVITPKGLLVMPTFTYGKEPYRIGATPSHTGKIPDAFLAFPNVFRSEHPTHSVCAWGDNAKDWIKNHRVEAPFGMNTPLDRLASAGVNILLIGVGQEANSIIHVAQEMARVPYLDRSKNVQLMDNGGKLFFMKVRRAGCSLGFVKIEPYVPPGSIKKGKIGDSSVQLMSAQPILKLCIELQRTQPDALLCDSSGCFACNEAREMIKGNLN